MKDAFVRGRMRAHVRIKVEERRPRNEEAVCLKKGGGEEEEVVLLCGQGGCRRGTNRLCVSPTPAR